MAGQSSGRKPASARSGKSQVVRASPTSPAGPKARTGATRTPAPGAAATTANPATATTANPATAAASPATNGSAAGAAARSRGGFLGAFAAMGATRLIIWVLSLYGVGASVWLTITHYDTKITLACPDTGLINCAKVTTSSQSMVFGVFPVAVLGLAFYVFFAVISSPWFWAWTDRLRPELARQAGWIRLGSVIVGMGFVLYLVYAELIQIKNICLWCTSVHVATFLIFALLVFYSAFAGGTSRGETI